MLNTRVTVQFRFAITALALLLVTNLMGCKADSNYFATANSSVGSGDGSSSDAAVGFKVTLKTNTAVPSLLHKFGDITAPCEIPTSAIDTPTQINCMMNMMEYDLWFYGYEYQVNVPATNTNGIAFCSFLRQKPHRYYKGEAGAGPTAVAIVMTDGALTGCSINGAPGTINPTQKTCGNAEAVFTSGGTVSSCVYDYSKDIGTAGPNCCEGTANVNVTTNTTVGTPPPPSTSIPTKVDYGGKIANCTESANDFVDGWPKETTTNIAINLLSEVGAGGLIKAQKLPSVFALSNLQKRKQGPSDFLNAGFHGWDQYAASPATFDPSLIVPKSMKPDFDLGAAGTHSGPGATVMPQAGYGAVVFECLNGAGEVRHRINMYANAWNTIEDFKAFTKDGNASVVDPNRTGTAGLDCSAVNGAGQSCNTIWGFDDMIKNNGPLGCAGDPNAYCFPYEGSRGSPP